MKSFLFFCFIFFISGTYAAKSPKILIGATPQNPPFNILADERGNFYGFDIDIMGEICKRLKLKCQFKPIMFNNIFTILRERKIDIADAGIIITPERSRQFLFSLPYLESNAQFMVNQQSSINQPLDIKNKKVGVRQGTPFKNLALRIYNNQITAVEFSSISDMLEALSTDAIDAVIMDAEAAKYWFTNNDGMYKLIGSQIPIGGGYAIMANLDQTNLIEQINEVLLNLEADGTYLEIYTRYFDL